MRVFKGEREFAFFCEIIYYLQQLFTIFPFFKWDRFSDELDLVTFQQLYQKLIKKQ